MLCWMQPTQHAQQHCLAWLNLCMIFLAEGPRMPGWGVTNTAGSKELFKGLPMSLTEPETCMCRTDSAAEPKASFTSWAAFWEREREFAVQTQPRRLLAGKREQWFSGKTDSSLSTLNAHRFQNTIQRCPSTRKTEKMEYAPKRQEKTSDLASIWHEQNVETIF